jgi:hypothetical protein
MNPTIFTLSTMALLSVSGCVTYPRFAGESSRTASQLMEDFGISNEHRLVDPNRIVGNTLRSDLKVFLTDSNTVRRYFGTKGSLLTQDSGTVAYGILRIGSDGRGKGDLGTYQIVDGVFAIQMGMCSAPGRLLVTQEIHSGEMTCWTNVCLKSLPVGWEKWSCSIERGNSLRTGEE